MMAAAVAGTAMAATAPGMQQRRADVGANGRYELWNGDVNRVAKAPTATRAAATLDFTYAGEVYTALTGDKLSGITAGKSQIILAFEVPAGDVKRFVGNTITSINVTTGTNGVQNNQLNPISDVTVFISKDLTKAPFYSQAAPLGNEAWAEYKVALDQTYTITEEDAKDNLYVGYRLTIPTGGGYYIPVDYTPAAPNTLLLGVVKTGIGQPASFDALGDYYGALCLGFTVEGETVPSDWAIVTDYEFPTYVKTGETFSYQMNVQNIGSNPIQTFEVTTQVGDETPNVQTLKLSKALASHAQTTLSVNNIPVNTEGIHTVKVSITGANGNPCPDAVPTEVIVSSYVNGYDRNLVVEDATGLWCGWCPGGIVMLDYIKATYGDRFFPIGVHSGDAMYCEDYEGFIDYYISGYPTVLFNRVMQFTPTVQQSDLQKYADNVYSYFTSFPAYTKLDMDCKVSDDETSVKVDATAEFALDLDVPHLMAFVVIDDNAGSYLQTNYFAKGGNGADIKMGAWNLKPSKARWNFADVAVALEGWPGIKGSIPASVKKATPYKYSLDLPITGVSNDLGRIVGLVVNGLTGEIVNAAQFSFKKVTAVDEIAGEGSDIAIEAGKGAISVSGAKKVAVYTLDGREAGMTNLPAGLYIVKADNVTKKVMVK